MELELAKQLARVLELPLVMELGPTPELELVKA